MNARQGSARDRGSADRYYGRPFDPHYFEGARYSGRRVDIRDPDSEEYQAYLMGWQETTDRRKRVDMNEQIAKLYDQAIVLKGNADYVAGELDPVKFAELIVQECIFISRTSTDGFSAGRRMAERFGVES